MCLPAHLPVNQMTKFNLQNDYNSDNPINPYAFVQQSLLLPVTIDLLSFKLHLNRNSQSSDKIGAF